jgi:hypothetical protein
MRSVLRLLVIFFAVVVSATAATAVATADDGDLGTRSYPCTDGYSCYWDTASYPGAYDAKWVAPSCGWHHLTPIGWGDRISNVANRSGHAIVYLYNWEKNLSGTYANNKTDAVSVSC